MSHARSPLLLLTLVSGCHDQVESLDETMSARVASVPATLEIPAQLTRICPGPLACVDSVHDHRLELSLRPVKPATRQVAGDVVHIAGSFRLTRLNETAEVLAEGPLIDGTLSRDNATSSMFVELSFARGTFTMIGDDGAWQAPTLELQRED
jgi:hypothetical protein